MHHLDLLDLYVEELPAELLDLQADALPGEMSLRVSSLTSFTTGSSFSCPGSSIGTLTTVGTYAP